MNDIMKDRLIELFDELDVIEYREVKLRSDRISNYKIIADKLFTNKEAIKIITNLTIRKKIDSETKNKCGYEIAGVYTGGFIFASHVERELGVSIVNVDYKKRRIDGKVKPNCHYLFLEDVTTTGGSLVASQEMLGEYGTRAVYAISIVDREEGAIDNLKSHGIILDPLLFKSELGITVD